MKKLILHLVLMLSRIMKAILILLLPSHTAKIVRSHLLKNVVLLLLILCGVSYSCKKETVDLDVNQLVAVWKLHAFIDKNNNVLDTPDVQISFTADNCITIFTSNNYGQGKFYQNGNKIAVQGLTLTDRQYDLDNDRRLVDNLSGSYVIAGDTLRILSDNDCDLVFVKTQIKDIYQCDISTLLIDKIDSNQYYSEDIFQPDYSSIYGKWFLSLYSIGGFTGGEGKPRFDFLEVKKNGIYGICKGFELVEYGKIEITKKINEELLLLNFIPTYYLGDSNWYAGEKRLTFPVNNTFTFYDNCLGCYRSFYRIE